MVFGLFICLLDCVVRLVFVMVFGLKCCCLCFWLVFACFVVLFSLCWWLGGFCFGDLVARWLWFVWLYVIVGGGLFVHGFMLVVLWVCALGFGLLVCVVCAVGCCVVAGFCDLGCLLLVLGVYCCGFG